MAQHLAGCFIDWYDETLLNNDARGLCLKSQELHLEWSQYRNAVPSGHLCFTRRYRVTVLTRFSTIWTLEAKSCESDDREQGFLLYLKRP